MFDPIFFILIFYQSVTVTTLMNKLFWIVCEDKDMTLFEGRFQGRTRGAAIKFLKKSIERSSLKGLVFTISEVPVFLIREIIAEMLGIPFDSIGVATLPAVSVDYINLPGKQPGINSDDQLPTGIVKGSLSNGQAAVQIPVDSKRSGNMRRVGNPGLGDDYWSEVHVYWKKCRSIRDTSIKFGLSQNSVKSRARREGWRKDIPPS
jgi:hypothetical protein